MGEQRNFFPNNVRKQLKVSENQEQNDQAGEDEQQITHKAAQNVIVENERKACAEKPAAPAAAIRGIIGLGIEQLANGLFELAEQHLSQAKFNRDSVGSAEQHHAENAKHDVGHPDAEHGRYFSSARQRNADDRDEIVDENQNNGEHKPRAL